ncbi:HAD family phosphatase [Reichenbachiella sp. MALMAid0571]|uniref:HAD family hydrolase n=1 Tax=Reichenbachiella sp. MALMAid0571 TaxID=3143939 RepID=UPI0032DF5700
MNINTFIFDLGGVIIGLDEQATINSFSEITATSPIEIQKRVDNSDIFQHYEKGLISNKAFRKGINKTFDCNLSNQQVDYCWNAMLLSITTQRLELLSALREKYKVIILSNTNKIHIEAFNKILEKVSGKDSLSFFADYVFFSHELNMRKPDIEIYREILTKSKTKASEALFMDDKLENLEGAKKVGIHTKLISSPDQVLELKQYV